MIDNLMVLNSSTNNSRDITWNDDPDPKVIGYNIYRSFDSTSNWTLLNPDFPHPGHFYRDETVLTPVTYTLQEKDWISFGNDGQWIFKVPKAPIWSDVVKGRSVIANNPDDVSLMINGKYVRVGRVDGQDGLVTMTNFNTLYKDASTSTKPSNPLVKDKNRIPPDLEAVVTYKQLTNYVDIFIGVRTFYSVVPVLEGGQEQHLVGAPGSYATNSLEIGQIDYMQTEMVRRNAWIFEQVGEPAFLMVRKTKGVLCGCLVANGEPRTGCPSCYETGIVGGYYGPFDLLFIDPDTAAVRTLDEGGAKVERTARSYLGRTPIVASGDLIVRRNGDRMVIHNVVYKSPRGVLLQQDFDVELLQRKDTRYMIPLSMNLPQEPPTLYDPRFEPANPQEEPVTDPSTDPTKVWENPKKPKGRTVTFGNIQT